MRIFLSVCLMIGLAAGATLLMTSCESDDGPDWQTLFSVVTDLAPGETLDHAFIATTNGEMRATVDWEEGVSADVWLAWTREDLGTQETPVEGEPPLIASIRVTTGERVRVDLANMSDIPITFNAVVTFLPDGQ